MRASKQRRLSEQAARMRLRSTYNRAQQLEAELKTRPPEERRARFGKFWKQVTDDQQMLSKEKTAAWIKQDEVVPTGRVNCPYYGKAKAGDFNILMETNGNQCALITEAHSPCRMETRDQDPDFSSCELHGSARALEFETMLEPQGETAR